MASKQTQRNRARGVVTNAALAAMIAAASQGCSDGVARGLPPAHSTAAAALAPTAPAPAEPSASAVTPAAPGAPQKPYVEAVRAGRFAAAAELIAALPEAERNTPELRFLSARIAVERRELDKVRALTDGLSLPLVDAEIQAMRAEAALANGPYQEAASFFEGRGKTRDLVNAARALAKDGKPVDALRIADKALAQAQRLKRPTDERLAHALRVELLTAQGKAAEALTSQQWLAIKAPATPDGRAARTALEKTFSAKDLVTLLDNLIDAGAGKEAFELVEKVAARISKPEVARLRAEALYKARDYKRAAEAFVVASKTDSGRKAEHLYYAGRSLGRSKKEDEARERYKEVVRTFPKDGFAERASYQLAQLELLTGDFAAAEKAFTSYLGRFPKGESVDDAEFQLALTQLSSGKAQKARGRFQTLADRAKKLEAGFYRELEGVAAERAGDKASAQQIYTRVAQEHPLTWPAMAARARLEALSATLPPLIEPAPIKVAQPLGVTLPAKAAFLASLGLDGDAEAALLESEDTFAKPYVGRETEALCAMYGQLSRAKRRYRVGANGVAYETLMRAPTDADRWCWTCLYPTPYQGSVGELEASYSLPAGLIYGVMRQESAFDPDAQSPVGARGLMQLMPTTASAAAKEASIEYTADDIATPHVNMKIGAFYLSKLLKTFDGSLPLAVAAYNAGPTAVSRWVEKAKDLDADVWVARIPYEETRNYVLRVLSNTGRYQWLRSGDAGVASISLALPHKALAGEDDY